VPRTGTEPAPSLTEYATIKAVHVACAAASYALFFVRGLWMMNDSPLLARRWVRIVPHVNDTVLLATAIALAWMLRLSPLDHGWLGAKILALLVYIGLGMMAMRPGRPKRTRIAAWIAAQGVFLYIVAVAITRSPLLTG
jgi:uncharacterized membrane protein SirB2